MRAPILTVLALALGLSHDPTLAQTRAGDTPLLESIHMLDALNGWATTWEGACLRTTNGGTRWMDVGPRLQGHPAGSCGVPLTPLLAWGWARWAYGVTETRTTYKPMQIWRTVDGGRTWRYVTLPIRTVKAMQFVDARHGWVFASELTAPSEDEAVDMYRSADGGVTWSRVARAGPGDERSGIPFRGIKVSITFLDPMTGWMTGDEWNTNKMDANGFVYLYVTHDGGQTWRRQMLPRPPQARLPWRSITRPPVFFVPRDGVLPVAYLNLDPSAAPLGLLSRRVTTEIVVFYTTHDGGRTWTYATPLTFTPTPIIYYGPFSSFADIDHGWVMDPNVEMPEYLDTLYATSDGGRQWRTLRPGPPFSHIRTLEFVTPTVGWAISERSPMATTLLKTVDGGRTWAPVTYTVSR